MNGDEQMHPTLLVSIRFVHVSSTYEEDSPPLSVFAACCCCEFLALGVSLFPVR